MLNDIYSDMCIWLVDQKLTTLEEAKSPTRDHEKAEFIYHTLKNAAASDKLLLLDYEWSVLPLEQIKITCVTEREKKEFTYGH